MATGTASNPARWGYGQSTTDSRNLWLDVFGGEVMAAFDLATVFMDKHQVKTVGGGARSYKFPKVWKAVAEYHTPGTELLGEDIDTTEITVTVDDILVSHTALADLDKMLSHFDVRGEFSKTMGASLAKVFDKNVARQLILAARTTADGPFPAGNVITDANALNTSSTSGIEWIEVIRECNRLWHEADVPEDQPRYLAVNWYVFDALKYAADANGHYLVLNRDFAGQPNSGGIGSRVESMVIDGVTVVKTRNAPFTTDESADTSVYSKYRGNFSTTTGIAWTPMAMGSVKVMDINFEDERDARRLEDFLVAKMLVGHGTLRPECAIEIKTS